METLRRYWLAIFLAAANVAVAMSFYGDLPARIPTHWNLHGTVDGWMPKQQGAFALPALVFVLLAVMIAVAPRAMRNPGSQSLRRLYPQIVAATTGFLLYMTLLLMLVGTGKALDVPAYVSVGIGILTMIIGNGLGKLTRNSVVGIRTPWTLANEEVWTRAQRVGGWLLVLAGLMTLITGLLGRGELFGIAAVLAAAAVSVLYSYVISRRMDGERRSPQS
jgi:uncharacterized membrane protein